MLERNTASNQRCWIGQRNTFRYVRGDADSKSAMLKRKGISNQQCWRGLWYRFTCTKYIYNTLKLALLQWCCCCVGNIRDIIQRCWKDANSQSAMLKKPKIYRQQGWRGRRLFTTSDVEEYAGPQPVMCKESAYLLIAIVLLPENLRAHLQLSV